MKLTEKICLPSSILLNKIKNDTKNNAPGELKVEHLNLYTNVSPTQQWIPSLIGNVIQGGGIIGVKVFMERAGPKDVSLAIIESAISQPTDF